MPDLSQPEELATAFRLSPQQSFLFGLGALRPPLSQCAVLAEAIDPSAALQRLVASHEILRTSFAMSPGARVPVGQVVHDRADVQVRAEAREDDSLPLDPQAFDELLAREASAPFAIDRGPPIRVTSVGLPGSRSLIVVTALAACADCRSMLAMARELATPIGEKTEPIQHADYAEWRAELIAGDNPEALRGRAFWQEAMDSIDSPPRLLFASEERARGFAAAAKRIRVPITLDARDLAGLKSAASEARAGVDVFVEAAWQTLLARLSGAVDLLVAELADGRFQPDLDDAIGPYEQPVPIRVRIGRQTRFAEVLDQVRRGRAEALSRQDYGSDDDLRRVTELAIAGFASRATGAVPGVLSVSGALPAYTIALEWREDGRGEVWVDPAVHELADAEAVAAHLRAVLAAAVADPSELVARLPLLDDVGRARMVALGAGREPGPDEVPVHHAFELQAERTPTLAAIKAGGVELTFSQLNERSNRLAHHLLAVGAGRHAPVGLCMARRPAMITALLGIMKAGAAYLPLNLSHPSDRIAHQLAETGASIVVTEAVVADKLPALAAATLVCMDRDEQLLATQATDNPPRIVDAHDLAYVMYTSGSTGKPKGVAVTHRNLAVYTSAILERLGAERRTQFAAVSEISTDLGNTAIFPALAAGGCVHLIDPELSMDGAALAVYAGEHPIDVIKLTPTHLRVLLGGGDGFLPRHWLVLGGEPLSWDLIERIRATGATCRILNHYGPTEATVGCCTLEVPSCRGRGSAATVPIGRPLAGAHAYILDEQLEPVPVGVDGELCIAGAGVARGYVNRSDETAERFVADALGQAGGRIYRTGDRARFLRDGTIAFRGRVDDQVKIRGFRVEPGEIEATILRHPAVREAAVVAREDGEGELNLVAYLVASPEPTLSELRSFLGRSLPEHMMPSRSVAIDALPLTSSGKVDRRALPDPVTVQSRSVDRVAPRDELEQQIADIWCQLLRVDEVGVFDDFFSLGGHSLLATQAIMRVRRLYGNIPLGALFNSPTVAALAEAIRASQTVAAH